MTYTENYQKWLNFAELPDYLREELVAWMRKPKKTPSIQILSLVLQACVYHWCWY